MYKCEHTGKMIGPGVPQNRVVVEKRRKVYEKRIKRGKNKGQVELVEGWEIAKEIIVGPDAYRELTGLEPAMTQKRVALSPHIVTRDDTRPARRKKPWQNPSKRDGSKNTKSTKSNSYQGKKTGASSTRTPSTQRQAPRVEVVNKLQKNSKTTNSSSSGSPT